MQTLDALTDALPLHTVQRNLEDLYDKHACQRLVRAWLREQEIYQKAMKMATDRMEYHLLYPYKTRDGKAFESKRQRLRALYQQHSDPLDWLEKIVLTIVMAPNQTVETSAIMGQLAYAFDLPMTDKPDRRYSFMTCLEIINVFRLLGLYRIELHEWTTVDNELRQITTCVADESLTLPVHLQERAQLCMYLPPMLVPPEPLRHNRDHPRYPKGSVFNGNLRVTLHDGEACLDHLDRMGSVGLSLNQAILCQHSLQIPKGVYQIEKPRDRQRALRNFDRFINQSYVVFGLLMRLGNRFYLPPTYDFRGRSYCGGYHVNYQGDDMHKGMVELAEQQLLNVSPDTIQRTLKGIDLTRYTDTRTDARLEAALNHHLIHQEA